MRAPEVEPTPPDERPTVKPGVEYRGGPLDADRGPGLGCFWVQIVALIAVIFLAPLSAAWQWPVAITIVLFAAMIVLLLFVGQTIIFLLRLVAADRRAAGRRRPMRSATRTVGEIEDETPAGGKPAEDASPDPGEGQSIDGAKRVEGGLPGGVRGQREVPPEGHPDDHRDGPRPGPRG